MLADRTAVPCSADSHFPYEISWKKVQSGWPAALLMASSDLSLSPCGYPNAK